MDSAFLPRLFGFSGGFLALVSVLFTFACCVKFVFMQIPTSVQHDNYDKTFFKIRWLGCGNQNLIPNNLSVSVPYLRDMNFISYRKTKTLKRYIYMWIKQFFCMIWLHVEVMFSSCPVLNFSLIKHCLRYKSLCDILLFSSVHSDILSEFVGSFLLFVLMSWIR